MSFDILILNILLILVVKKVSLKGITCYNERPYKTLYLPD
jgi:hypothetical protein